MPYYLCRTAGEDGRVVKRSLLAPSREECRDHLEGQGFLVLSVSRDWKKISLKVPAFGKKVKLRDFILFNQELIALIKSGYPVLKSIQAVAARMKSLPLKEILIRVEADIKAGKALSEAFRPYEDLFSKVYTAGLMAGERSGNLPGALARYVQYAKVIADTKSRVRAALAYPAILILFSFVLMAILVNFIIPKFADFYQDFDTRLPVATQWLLAVSMAIRSWWPFTLTGSVLAVLLYIRMLRKPKTRRGIDRLRLRIPFIGSVLLESGVALFCRTLGLLLEAGISLLSAIGIAVQAVPNTHIIRDMSRLADDIKNGESLSGALSRVTLFPPLALDMIRIGETSANLQGMLADVADFYDERIRVKIQAAVSMIEPIIIIVMGLVVAGMLLSVYLPIFNIIRVAR
ncbi:MAG: type II secretion system F family protein [Acidobacteriota bacterium]|nr:type II secretion system F family protein [Acidobacteriota bacterium]